MFAADLALDPSASPFAAVAALVTLTLMEIVLGIDNVIFIAVVAARLPHAQQRSARNIGLMVALLTRLLLLASLYWIMQYKDYPLFRLSALGVHPGWLGDHGEAVNEISARDLVLLLGGLFLIYKSVKEIHHKLEGDEEEAGGKGAVTFGGVIVQIAILDIVFSLDSVITALGMAQQIWVMVTAMLVSVGVMILFAGFISDFVGRHPTVKILALAFLILIGVVLVAEAFEQHIPKGYIYFAMAFSVGVEMVNLQLRSRASAVSLREKRMPAERS